VWFSFAFHLISVGLNPADQLPSQSAFSPRAHCRRGQLDLPQRAAGEHLNFAQALVVIVGLDLHRGPLRPFLGDGNRIRKRDRPGTRIGGGADDVR
jgi:hypothetical protein